MNIKLREFSKQDDEIIASLLNNRKIWDNLRDYIPFPYKKEDAQFFIRQCLNEDPPRTFAIILNESLTGSIGLVLQNDIYEGTAEIGYWLGEPYWGKGIATEAIKKIVRFGFDELKLRRIFTGVFDFNIASQKALIKAGFRQESTAEKAIKKNGKILDEYRFAILNPVFK